MARSVGIWTMAVVIGLLFVLLGLSKLAGSSAVHWAERLARWHYPAIARYLIGGIEMVAGIVLLVPTSRRWAAVVLMALMVGAFGTHLAYGEFPRLLPPLILGGLLFVLYRWGTPTPPRKVS